MVPFASAQRLRSARRFCVVAPDLPEVIAPLAPPLLQPSSMNTPITFRDVPPSPAIEALVRERADKLARQFDHVTTCRVTVSRNNKHHKHGDSYTVRLDVHVPQVDLVSERSSGVSDDLYATVEAAFEDARHRLQQHYDKARDRRGEAR